MLGFSMENITLLAQSRPNRPLKIAITADLHYGTRHNSGNQSTLKLVEFLQANPHDLILLGGDVGAGEDFARCLAMFADLPGQKALVPGNHDVWVRSFDQRGDSKTLYEEYLPTVCQKYGFHYLDDAPLLLPEHDLAIVGLMNWYDYSWNHEELKQRLPDWAERLETKRFPRGQHNDANFVKWPWSDPEFTTIQVERLTRHLADALAACSNACVLMHHPPLRGLLYPAPEPFSVESLMWRAFSGNTRVEAILTDHADRLAAIWCGHTHYAIQTAIGKTTAYNIGGDYHFKRLHTFHWPSRMVEERDFMIEDE